ncbi:LacI family DNA-binding transcriptional regulator [Microbacterium sp. C23T]
MTTMRDVAAHAGVSAKTVSRVFNGDPHVLPQTRAHVQQVMADLDYVPNVLATTFRNGRSSVIGVAVPDIIDPFFATIARAVDDIARAHGMSTLVASLGDQPHSERPTLESLLGRQLSGLIVAPVGTDHSWLRKWQQHTPIVFVDRAPIGLATDTFTENDETGAYHATRHLLEHGHRRIAYLGDMIHLSTETRRLAGWRRALTEYGLAPDEELIVAHASDAAITRDAMKRLRTLPSPPTAVFSANARCSMALVQATRKHPIAVVGFGDFPMADVLSPTLTVIDQNPARIGTLAAERVLSRLDHPTRRQRQKNILDVELIERESCKVHQ